MTYTVMITLLLLGIASQTLAYNYSKGRVREVSFGFTNSTPGWAVSVAQSGSTGLIAYAVNAMDTVEIRGRFVTAGSSSYGPETTLFDMPNAVLLSTAVAAVGMGSGKYLVTATANQVPGTFVSIYYNGSSWNSPTVEGYGTYSETWYNLQLWSNDTLTAMAAMAWQSPEDSMWYNTIITTTDGGTTWSSPTQASFNIDQQSSFAYLGANTFLGTTVNYATDSNQLMSQITTDNSATWSTPLVDATTSSHNIFQTTSAQKIGSAWVVLTVYLDTLHWSLSYVLSGDGGVTFGDPQLLATNATHVNFFTGNLAKNGYWYVTYLNNGGETILLYASNSDVNLSTKTIHFGKRTISNVQINASIAQYALVAHGDALTVAFMTGNTMEVVVISSISSATELGGVILSLMRTLRSLWL